MLNRNEGKVCTLLRPMQALSPLWFQARHYEQWIIRTQVIMTERGKLILCRGSPISPLAKLSWLSSPAWKSYRATKRSGSSDSAALCRRFSLDIHFCEKRSSGESGRARVCIKASGSRRKHNTMVNEAATQSKIHKQGVKKSQISSEPVIELHHAEYDTCVR